MSLTDSFLSQLIGYHDMRVNGGSLLPRRSLLSFLRGRVEDIGGETQVSIVDEAAWLTPSHVHSSEPVNDFSPDGFAALTEIAFDPQGGDPRIVTGFDATDLTVYEKRVWNLSTDMPSARDLIIAHDDSGSAANNRVITPDELDLTITPGNAAKLIRNAADSAWRVLPCLV